MPMPRMPDDMWVPSQQNTRPSIGITPSRAPGMPLDAGPGQAVGPIGVADVSDMLNAMSANAVATKFGLPTTYMNRPPEDVQADQDYAMEQAMQQYYESAGK